MPIDLRGYKVVYKNIIYNVVQAEIYFDALEPSEGRINYPETLRVCIIDSDARLATLIDKNTEFQFIPR